MSYKIYIHKSVSIHKVSGFLNRFIDGAKNKTAYGFRSGGGRSSKAFLRRSRFGMRLDKIDKDLVFRRMSTHKRIFAVIPIYLLSSYDGSEIEQDQCYCALHLGGTHVKLKEPFKEEDYILYYEEN